MEKNRTEGSTLYLVATPIGNLGDISERALKVLREADFIAAEDTRNTMKLLSCFSIRAELVSYHEHNRRSAGERILDRIEAGESCALVTDAGMPAISDPGEDIVAMAAERAIKVTVVPGACAAVSALALSGLPTGRFAFEGFIPVPKAERQKRLARLCKEDRTMIIYEAPHKLRATLKDLAEVLGEDRPIALCREITKLNEEVQRMTVGDACQYYSDREPRGEYVLIVKGTSCSEDGDDNPLCSLSPEEHVEHYVALGERRMDAIKHAAKDRGMTKSELYKLVSHDQN